MMKINAASLSGAVWLLSMLCGLSDSSHSCWAGGVRWASHAIFFVNFGYLRLSPSSTQTFPEHLKTVEVK